MLFAYLLIHTYELTSWDTGLLAMIEIRFANIM